MNINYTWEFSQFHVVPSLNNLSNVITKISFTCHGEHIDSLGRSFKDYWTGSTLIELDENSTFIPLDQITQEIAEKWVQDSENKKQRNINWIKAKVASRIQEQVNPTLIVINSPFEQK
jgi:hypothetical protein